MRIHLLILGGSVALTIASGTLSVACATPNIPGDEAPTDDPSGNAPGTETKTPTGAYKRDGGSSAANGSAGAGAGAGTDGGTGGGTGTGTTPKPPPTTQADAAPPATTNACATSANQNSCYTCCETQVPAGVPFLDNEWGKCQCELPGACAQACGNEYCAGFAVQPGGACDSCLAAHNSACNTQADNACAANATCNKLFACADNSGCAAKP
jgi:hypothetical protein